MSVDPLSAGWWNQNRSDATPSVTASTPNEAPVQGTQPVAAGVPPAQQQGATTPDQQLQQQPGETNQDFEARLRDAEARAQQAQSALSELVQGIQSYATMQNVTNQEAAFKQRRQDIIAQSRNYSPQEADSFLDRELGRLDSERTQYFQGMLQQEQQARMQDRRVLGTPLWVDNLMRQNGLPETARERLMRLAQRDPDLAAQEAPAMKAEYDRFAAIEQRLNQLSRTDQAHRLMDQGAGVVGGQSSVGGAPREYRNADDRAEAIYWAIQDGTYSGGGNS